jgi:hypothetical protein
LLNDFLPIPTPDECKYLILKVIEQAVRDYLSLEKTNTPIEKLYYETACEFLFDDDYIVEFGGANKTLRDFLDILDISLDWFRERVMRLKAARYRNISIQYLIEEKKDEKT